MAKKEFTYEFDPVKEQKGNEQAQSVVWSTNSINAAVDAIGKGLPLKINPFIGTNTKLLKPELVFRRTEDEIEDYVRCMQDICYFAEKCHVMTPEGLRKIKLREYQEKYLKHLQANRFSVYIACRQAGKSLTFFNKITIILNINILKYLLKNKFKSYLAYLQEKYIYFYINDNELVVYLPLFELYYIIDSSFIGKIRYHLYKFIYRLKLWQGRSDKNELNQMMKAQDMLNTIKKDILNGH